MIVWRLEKKEHKDTAFSGRGATLVSGRWNPRGAAIIYTSSSLSLAILEKLVHAVSLENLKTVTMISMAAEIPKNVATERIEIDELPRNWRRYDPPPDQLKAIGRDWVADGKSAILRVPSAIVPTEYNFLLNSKHPDFSKIKINVPEPFTFDTRFFK